MSGRTVLGFIIFLFALVLPARLTSAALATWGLSGNVTSVTPAIAGSEVNVGDILTGSVTYDPAIAPIDFGYVRGYFSVTQIILNVGSFSTSGDGGTNAQIDLWGTAGLPPDVVTVQGDMPGTINGMGFIQFKIQLDTATAPGMTPTLTAQPPILSNWNSRVFNLFLGGGAQTISGELTMIPEPTLLPLLALLLPLRRSR